MKKKTILASAIALAAGAMLGATVAPTTVQTAQTQQVAEPSGQARNNTSPPQKSRVSRIELSALASLGESAYSLPNYTKGFGRQHKWCDASGARSCNKITHSRRQRRKHRRAA